MEYSVYDPELDTKKKLNLERNVLGRGLLEEMLHKVNGDLTILDDSYVSREHCFIDCSLKPIIFDNNSKNGTYVNGERVYANFPVSLNNGDVISLGPWKLEFIAKK